MTVQSRVNNQSANPKLLSASFQDGRIGWNTPAGKPFGGRGLSGSVVVNGHSVRLYDVPPPTGTDAAGNGGSAHEYRLPGGLLWRWNLRSRDGFIELDACLVNVGDRDVTIGEWNLLHGCSGAGGLIDLGPDAEQVRFFKWQPWSMGVERLTAGKQQYHSANLCHLFDPRSGLALLLGFVSLDRMQTGHALRYEAGRGVTEFRATCWFSDYRLKPGAQLRSETLRIRLHADPYEALDSWADALYGRYQPSFEGVAGVCIAGTPGMRWPEALEERARIATETLKGFGIGLLYGGPHALFKHGLPGNWLTFDTFEGDREGSEARLRRLHAQGFAFKFWFSPFWFFGEAEGTLEENRENLLKDADGKPITRAFRQGGWEFGRGPFTERPLTQYFLDGTHPATRAYLARVFKTYRDMGIRAYMLDFLSIMPGAKPYDETLLPLESARAMLLSIREAAGPDTHFQTAVASTPSFIGCVQAARVGRDYGEGRPVHPMPNWRNAETCLHDRHFANAHSFVQNAAACWFTNRKVFMNDLNVLRVGQPIPLELARLSSTMFGLSGDSPVALGDSLGTLAPERLRLIKLCLPRTEGIPVPVDLFDNVEPEGHCHILKKAVKTDWDDYLLVAVFNTSPDNHVPVTDTYRTTLEFARLGLHASLPYRVYEFWNEEYLGTFRTAFACSVPPDGCRLYRIARAREYPWLLGTDLHIEQGRAELESLAWDEATCTLKGVARRPTGETGSLFFLLPRHLLMLNHPEAVTLKEVIDMQTVIRLPLVFRAATEPFELRFEALDTPYVSRQGWLPYATESEWLAYVAEHRCPLSSRVIE